MLRAWLKGRFKMWIPLTGRYLSGRNFGQFFHVISYVFGNCELHYMSTLKKYARVGIIPACSSATCGCFIYLYYFSAATVRLLFDSPDVAYICVGIGWVEHLNVGGSNPEDRIVTVAVGPYGFCTTNNVSFHRELVVFGISSINQRAVVSLSSLCGSIGVLT